MDPLWLKVEAFAEKSLHLVALTRVCRVQETGEAPNNIVVLGCENDLFLVCVFSENLLIELEDSLSILKLFDQV